MATFDKAAVIDAAEEKILELAFSVSGRLSLKKSRSEIETGAALCRYKRVLNNTSTVLFGSELQSVIQACIKIGKLKL